MDLLLSQRHMEQAEPDTDEIYAKITLLPYHDDQSGITVPDSPILEPLTCMVQSFCKTLTTSKTSKNGGLSLLRRHTVDCLPPLASFGFYVLESILRFFCPPGNEWLLLIFRTMNGVFVICCKGGGMSLLNYTPFVTTGQSHLAILAISFYAIASGNCFSVAYKPRDCRSPFIISLNKYLEAQSYRFSFGMKFEMKFEGEEVLEQRFSGSIVGVGETVSSKWPDFRM